MAQVGRVGLAMLVVEGVLLCMAAAVWTFGLLEVGCYAWLPPGINLKGRGGRVGLAMLVIEGVLHCMAAAVWFGLLEVGPDARACHERGALSGC